MLCGQERPCTHPLQTGAQSSRPAQPQLKSHFRFCKLNFPIPSFLSYCYGCAKPCVLTLRLKKHDSGVLGPFISSDSFPAVSCTSAGPSWVIEKAPMFPKHTSCLLIWRVPHLQEERTDPGQRGPATRSHSGRSL